jgi:type II secretory pathway component GspD/PulD (secretin)
MTELVNNVDYISAFRVNTGGNAATYLTRFEEAITSNASQLQAHQSQSSQSSSQTSGSGGQSDQTSSRQSWSLTPQGANNQIQVRLDRQNNEILVSGNFSDILMLNRAIVATTGEKDGITVTA